jgi:Flp pilus assembly protein TadG
MTASRAAGDRAQATAELVLCLPFVAVCLLAVVHVALVARDQVLVTHAAREAARAASVGADADAAARSGPLDPSRLTVTVSRTGVQVRVDLVYASDPGVPIVGRFTPSHTLRASAVMTAEPPDPGSTDQ